MKRFRDIDRRIVDADRLAAPEIGRAVLIAFFFNARKRFRYERRTIDSEIYTKALYNYSKLKNKNPSRLIEYAKIMGIQKKVYDTMMVVLNEL